MRDTFRHQGRKIPVPNCILSPSKNINTGEIYGAQKAHRDHRGGGRGCGIQPRFRTNPQIFLTHFDEGGLSHARQKCVGHLFGGGGRHGHPGLILRKAWPNQVCKRENNNIENIMEKK